MDKPSDRIRVRLRVSWLEIEYEGTPEHIRDHMFELVDHVLSVQPDKSLPISSVGGEEGASSDGPSHATGSHDLSTSTIASILSAKTGTQLVLAASAKLRISDGKAQFARKEILDEMKSAPAYYKTTYSSNLTKSLDNLVKADKLRSTGAGVFALSAKEEGRLRQALDENS